MLIRSEETTATVLVTRRTAKDLPRGVEMPDEESWREMDREAAALGPSDFMVTRDGEVLCCREFMKFYHVETTEGTWEYDGSEVTIQSQRYERRLY